MGQVGMHQHLDNIGSIVPCPSSILTRPHLRESQLMAPVIVRSSTSE